MQITGPVGYLKATSRKQATTDILTCRDVGKMPAKTQLIDFYEILATPAGLEPATTCLEGIEKFRYFNALASELCPTLHAVSCK
jgi:hypothetical protein